MDAGLFGGLAELYDGRVYSEWDLWEAALSHDRMAAVSAHGIRQFPTSIGNRQLHYFTLLRKPEAQFRSVVRYMVQEPIAFALPPEFSQEKPLMAHLLAPASEPVLYLNAQTNHLALFPWCAATGGRCDPFAISSWAASDRAAYLQQRLDLARSVLDGFLAVGTVEQLKRSLEVVRRRSLRIGIPLLSAEFVQRLNVTGAPQRLYGAAGLAPESRLLEVLHDDHELYGYATELLAGSN